MAMTMTQKILAAHAGLDSVEAGQLILVNLDLVLGNDITSPVAIKAFKQMGKENVFDKEKRCEAGIQAMEVVLYSFEWR